MKLASLALPFLAATASAQLATYNAGNGIEYALSIPQSTKTSGRGPLFFQMQGPSDMEWIGMGIGSQMRGSLIFVMYADGQGNVTVSPRLGVGEVMPMFYEKPRIQLLEGTGVADGMMTANVRCMNCESWQGGSLDLSSSQASFIHAHKTGAPLDTTDRATRIQQHDRDGETFSFNLAQAAGGSATNPFSAQATMAAGGAGATSSGSEMEESSESMSDMVLKAHGIIMGLTVVLLFPIGALLMRVFSFGALWAVHGAFQIVSLILLTAGFGTGYWVAGELGIRYSGQGFTHTVFGTVLFAFFWIQPILGAATHAMFKKAGKRTVTSHAHIWWGRIVMILAIINGGLGLQLADNSPGGNIAYGVVAGIVGLAYIVIVGFVEGRKVMGGGRSKGNVEKTSSTSS